MSLRKQQSEFTIQLSVLITCAYALGYELTLGDTYPGKFKHKQGSQHEKGLAIDLNLFKNGRYLTETEDHEDLGKMWESLGGTWGGRFSDGNHYSWGETKR